MNKMLTGLLILFLSSLLGGCLQLGSTYSDNGNDNSRVDSGTQPVTKVQQPIIWGKDTKKSVYLNPVDYAEYDPLAKLQQQQIALMMGEMLNIPAGFFIMGNGIISRGDETPIHQVSIKSFKMGKYEVTQKQWQAIMGSNPSSFYSCYNCPVENVSWNDIQDFIKKLNLQTKQSFRLPSEAEWEYACRSGGKDEKYCGGSNESSLAWYSSNSGSRTYTVGSKSPNGLGLYDMSGNVWEWVQDCWHESYSGAPMDGSAWNSGNCNKRVLRGGSWGSESSNLRSAKRDMYTSTVGVSTFGFRLALDQD